jgi:hypothetical protein
MATTMNDHAENVLSTFTMNFVRGLAMGERNELGCLEAITLDTSEKQVSTNDYIVAEVLPDAVVSDSKPSMYSNNAAAATTAEKISCQFSTSRQTGWDMSSDEEQARINNGTFPGFIEGKTKKAAFALESEIEGVAYLGLLKGASNAIGTAAASVFATSTDGIGDLKKEFIDDNCMADDRSVVMDSTDYIAISKLLSVVGANFAGGPDQYRSGNLAAIYGFQPRISSAVAAVSTVGSGYYINNASCALKDTTVALKSGTGTIPAGMYFTVNGDTRKYIAHTALSANSLTINRPGAKVAWADSAAVTVGNSFTPVLGLNRSAFTMFLRPPIGCNGQNQNVEETLIQDPRTGITYMLRREVGIAKVQYSLHIAYTFIANDPKSIKILLS